MVAFQRDSKHGHLLMVLLNIKCFVTHYSNLIYKKMAHHCIKRLSRMPTENIKSIQATIFFKDGVLNTEDGPIYVRHLSPSDKIDHQGLHIANKLEAPRTDLREYRLQGVLAQFYHYSLNNSG